jgi:hypothetical protein
VNFDITVATISISKEDWYYCSPNMTEQEVLETMIQKKFDVVPISDGLGAYKQYYTWADKDCTQIVANKIEPTDRLYYLTHVQDAVWFMNKNKKAHLFLSNGHDENDIVGLLSLSDFNNREFYVYLFSLLSYIEREFATLITSDKDEAFKILEALTINDKLKKQLTTSIKRFKQDEKNQNENNYKEYLYLNQLVKLVLAEEKHLILKYNNNDEFESGIDLLKNLRNEIAHPVRSVVRNINDLENLDRGINKLYEFKERIDHYVKSPDNEQ